MKKLKNNLLIALLIIAPFTFTKAQNDYAGSSKRPLFTSDSQVKMLYNTIMLENKSGVRAMKDLSKRFTDPSSAKWFVGSKIISASFIKDEIKYSVSYDKNGHWIRTIKSYNETRMQENIRELVKRSKYFDNDISYVWEVQEGSFLYYVIHLQDKKTVNEIVVYDEEITLFNTFVIQ
jgi:hypothetical protein